jgi:hypothetical protein
LHKCLQKVTVSGVVSKHNFWNIVLACLQCLLASF